MSPPSPVVRLCTTCRGDLDRNPRVMTVSVRDCEVCQLLAEAAKLEQRSRWSWAIAIAAGMVALVFLWEVLHG